MWGLNPCHWQVLLPGYLCSIYILQKNCIYLYCLIMYSIYFLIVEGGCSLLVLEYTHPETARFSKSLIVIPWVKQCQFGFLESYIPLGSGKATAVGALLWHCWRKSYQLIVNPILYMGLLHICQVKQDFSHPFFYILASHRTVASQGAGIPVAKWGRTTAALLCFHLPRTDPKR